MRNYSNPKRSFQLLLTAVSTVVLVGCAGPAPKPAVQPEPSAPSTQAAASVSDRAGAEQSAKQSTKQKVVDPAPAKPASAPNPALDSQSTTKAVAPASKKAVPPAAKKTLMPKPVAPAPAAAPAPALPPPIKPQPVVSPSPAKKKVSAQAQQAKAESVSKSDSPTETAPPPKATESPLPAEKPAATPIQEEPETVDSPAPIDGVQQSDQIELASNAVATVDTVDDPAAPTEEQVAIPKLDALPYALPDGWQLARAVDLRNGEQHCRWRSPAVSFFDGYEDSTLHFEVFPDNFQINSRSHLDTSYPNAGIQLGWGMQLTFENTVGDTRAVIAKQFSELVTGLKSGEPVTLFMGFWPTWPVTETRQIAMPVYNYRIANALLQECEAL